MAKYYVQSGSFRGIVDSYDEEAAAVWAVHHVMRLESPTSMNSAKKNLGQGESDRNVEADIGLFRLGDAIGVSERGFRRRDRMRIPTAHAVARWIQLIHSVDSLSESLDRAWDDQ